MKFSKPKPFIVDQRIVEDDEKYLWIFSGEELVGLELPDGYKLYKIKLNDNGDYIFRDNRGTQSRKQMN